MRYPSSASGADQKLTVGQAVALGALHGPTELLPISSSGHTGAVPWLLGWEYGELSPELRKSFEVALHAGTLVALLAGRRQALVQDLPGLTPGSLGAIALASVPPAVVGYTLERQIERRLGRPSTIAAGLVAGAAAMALADRCAEDRAAGEADARDGLLLGLAQACALVPGVSRSAATVAAARSLHFARADADRLSRLLALPVIAGATLLRGSSLLRRPPANDLAAALFAGGGASFVSSLLASYAMSPPQRDRALWPYALYRFALAGAIIARLARASRARRREPAPA